MRLLRHRDPALQVRVVREEREHQFVGARDVGGIPGERRPAERPLAFAEERADVLGDEARDRERVLEAGVKRHCK
jgi:hypothetical protein